MLSAWKLGECCYQRCLELRASSACDFIAIPDVSEDRCGQKLIKTCRFMDFDGFCLLILWSRLDVLIGLHSFRQMCFPTFEYLGCLGILGAISSNYFTFRVFGLCFAWTFATVCCGGQWWLWFSEGVAICRLSTPLCGNGVDSRLCPAGDSGHFFSTLKIGAHLHHLAPLKVHFPDSSAPKDLLNLALSPILHCSPHHCVRFLCFALHPPLLPRPPAASARHTTTHHTHITSNHIQLITQHSTHHTAQLITTLRLAGAALTRPHHTALITAQLITPLVTAQLITPLLGRGWLSCGRRSTQSLLEGAWAPLGRGWLSCGRHSTQSLLEELVRAWVPLGLGWLSCGMRGTQGLLEELLRAWSPLARS